MQFYLCVPVLALLTFSLIRNKWVSVALLLTASVAPSGYTVRRYLMVCDNMMAWWETVYTPLLTNLPLFLFGFVVNLLPAPRARLSAWYLVAALLFVYLSNSYLGFYGWHRYAQALEPFATGGIVALLIYYAGSFTVPCGPRSVAFWALGADLTYGVYLLQGLLNDRVCAVRGRMALAAAAALAFAFMALLAISTVAAYLMHRCIERPLNSWKRFVGSASSSRMQAPDRAVVGTIAGEVCRTADRERRVA